MTNKQNIFNLINNEEMQTKTAVKCNFTPTVNTKD